MTSCMSARLAAFGAVPPNSLMSAPAMKVRPAQISTMANAPSANAWFNPSKIP